MIKLLTNMAIGAVLLSGTVYLVQIEKVEAGYTGIRVDLLGSNKGVSSEEVGPGRYWIGFNEELYRFPTFAVNYVWTADSNEGSTNDESLTFQSVEGMNVSADIGITYSIDPEKTSDLFQKYRKGIDEITDIYLRNAVRNALVIESSVMPIRAIYGAGKTSLMENVEARVRNQVGDFGILIERVYWIGSLRLPDNVISSINEEIASTAKARQRENEIAGVIAEATKVREEAQGAADAVETAARGEANALRIVAEAQADANSLLNESLTPIVIQYQTMQKWNGILPRVTGDSTPLIQVPIE